MRSRSRVSKYSNLVYSSTGSLSKLAIMMELSIFVCFNVTLLKTLQSKSATSC